MFEVCKINFDVSYAVAFLETLSAASCVSNIIAYADFQHEGLRVPHF